MSRLIKYTVEIFIIFTLFFSAILSSASVDAEDNISVLIESTVRKQRLVTAHFQTFLYAQPQWVPPKY